VRYISRLCYDVSVRLSVTEVHWRIIANLGFKFRSINQSIKVFLEWPKWRSRCKVHYRCKKSVTEARKRLAEQMSFQLSLEGWQRFSDPTLPRIAAPVLLAGGSSRAMLASARLSFYFVWRINDDDDAYVLSVGRSVCPLRSVNSAKNGWFDRVAV